MTLDKHFSPAAIEPVHYKRWEESGLFSTQLEGSQPTYCIMMPPPNVTGSLHIGHALNYSLQDLLVRYHRMKGYRVLWQPGTDHAGIATQMVVERKLAKEGIKRKDLGREKFLEKVWKWKEESGGAIVAQQRRLGLTPDWGRARFTLDEGLSKAVRQVFVSFYNDGLIYRDKRLVNWDPQLQTAVSDLEVKSVEEKGTYWYIRYPLEGHQDTFVTVATSRPETLFGDVAVAVNPDDGRYQEWVGKKVRLPLSNRLIPIIADSYSDPLKGSGAVKITPAHDFNDFEVGKRHGLPLISIMDETGHLNENVPSAFQGLERFKARKEVVAHLESLGLLERAEETLQALPRSEKTQAILEPYLTDQWFVRADQLAAAALEAVQKGKTTLYPASWKNTYDHWLTHIQPWCISRQLWWGHPIPAWYGPDNKIFVALTESDACLQARAHYGKDVPLRAETDVLDTWFSSALWPFSTLGWPENTAELKAFYPTQVLITGTDILFFWVARMMMMGLKLTGQAPFKDVFLHALVRDEKGKKMSKTTGNVIDPLEIIDTYGTDALRFSLISLTVPGRDIKFSKAHVENSRHFATKLWNSARFTQHYGCVYQADFDPAQLQLSLNQWIVSEFSTTLQNLEATLAEYRFDEASKSIHQFTWGLFCDWYLELAKPLLVSEEKEVKKETQETVAFVLIQVCHILNIFMPFITEEIWAHLGLQNSLLMGQKWPTLRFSHERALKEVRWVIQVIEKVRSLRATFNVAPHQPLTMAIEEGDAIAKSAFESYEEVLRKLLRVESMLWGQPDTPLFQKACAKELTDNAMLRIPLGGLLNPAEERVRLQGILDDLVREKTEVESKLHNQSFMAKAPAEIVDKIKRRHQEALDKISKLTTALQALKED